MLVHKQQLLLHLDQTPLNRWLELVVLQNRQLHVPMLQNVLQQPLKQMLQLFYKNDFILLKTQLTMTKFHYWQLPLRVRQSNWQVFLVLTQRIVKYLGHYPIKVVLIMPSHLLRNQKNNIMLIPALYNASIFYGLVANSATVYTNYTLAF